VAGRSGEAEAPKATTSIRDSREGAHLAPDQVQRLHELLADLPAEANQPPNC